MYQHHSYARQKKPTPQKKTIITQQWANLSVSFRMVNWNNRIPSFAKVSPFHSPPSVLSASLFDAETEPTYSAIVLLVLSGNLMQLGTRQFISSDNKSPKGHSIIGPFAISAEGEFHMIFSKQCWNFLIFYWVFAGFCLETNLYNNPTMSGRGNGCSTINKALRFLVTDYICWARTFSRWFIIYLIDGDHKTQFY